MEKYDEYQTFYKKYEKIKNENAEKITGKYKENGDLEQILRFHLKDFLIKTAAADICIDTIKTTLFLISNNEKTSKTDKNFQTNYSKVLNKCKNLTEE